MSMEEDEGKGENEEEKKTSYGKRPLWQWILIYLVVGVILYALVYFFYISKRGGYNSNSQNTQQYSQPTDSMDNSSSDSIGVSNDILITMTNTENGDYLTDAQGMTLYTFDNDEPGKSNCESSCLANWPPYSAPSANPADLPQNIGVTQATDGTYMYTWMGMPLYYYVADQEPGDINGDGVGGIWHIVTP